MVRSALAASDPLNVPNTLPELELIELVVHELRWPEIVDIARERRSALEAQFPGRSRGDASRRIIAAADPDWEDRDLYVENE